MTIDDQTPFVVVHERYTGKAVMTRRERWRMRALRYRIAELEALLDAEFATLDTGPMIEEHRALIAERDALLKRYAEPDSRQDR